MGLSDCRPRRRARLLIPESGWPGAQLPTAAAALPSSRRFFPRALSPFTPGNPVRIFDRTAAQVLASRSLARWPFPVSC